MLGKKIQKSKCDSYVFLFTGICGLLWAICTALLLRYHIPLAFLLGWALVGVGVAIGFIKLLHSLGRQVQQAKNSEERVRLITQKTGTILYEWDFKEDCFTFSDHWAEKFGPSIRTHGLLQELEQDGRVHPQDLTRLREMLLAARAGTDYGEAIIRLHSPDCGYFWNRISAMCILGEWGEPVGAIGLIIDVNDEKKEAQAYKSKAERDALTGLYNKELIGQLVEQYLAGDGGTGSHALIMVDLDNFKAINDNLGHLQGDAVLTWAASIFQKTFRSGDLLGRVGGDEFIILLKNIPREKTATDKAGEICQRFHKGGLLEGIAVSASVGVALYPKDGSTFEALYRKADAALYMAKGQGKNQYQLYR